MRLLSPTNFETHGVGIAFDASKPYGGLPRPSRAPTKGTTVIWSVYTDAHTLSFGTHWFWAQNTGTFTGQDYFGCANRQTTGVWNHSLSCNGTDLISTDAITLGRWYRQALTRQEIGANVVYNYYYDLPDVTKVINTTQAEVLPATASTGHKVYLFSNTWSSGDEALDGRLDQMKWFEVAMGPTEVAEEAKYAFPHIPKYLPYIYGCWPNIALSDMKDVSGMGHHFSILDDGGKFVNSEQNQKTPRYVPAWPQFSRALSAPAAGVNLSLAVTEAADTILSGATTAHGLTATITEAADTIVSSASGTVTINAAVTESADTIVSGAGVGIALTAAITESADTIVSAASVATAGINASLAVTEAADTIVSSASTTIGLSAQITEAADSIVSGTAVAIALSLNVSEAADTVISTATTQTPGINIDFAVTESADTVLSGATSTLTGNVNVSEQGDSLSGFFDTGNPAVVVTTGGAGPGGHGRKKRLYILPDGTRIYATPSEIGQILKLFFQTKPEETLTKKQ